MGNNVKGKGGLKGFVFMTVTSVIASVFAAYDSIFNFTINNLIYSLGLDNIAGNAVTAVTQIISTVITVAVLFLGGRLYSKGIKGALKFIGSYYFANIAVFVLVRFITGIGYSALGNIQGTVFTLITVGSVVAQALVAGIIVLLADRAEVKAASLPVPSPSYDDYGNLVPVVKRQFFTVSRVLIFAIATGVADILAALIFPTVWDMFAGWDMNINFDYSLSHATSYFAGTITGGFTAVVFITAAVLTGKKLPDMIKIVGCAALGNYFSTAINKIFSAIIFAIGFNAPELHNVLTMAAGIFCEVISVLFAVAVATRLLKTKEFSEVE